jgi:hypothetical protein
MSLHSPKQQGDVALKAHIANVCFRGMLQVFYLDVAKVDPDVASVLEVCCKHLFKIFQTYIASV